MKKIDVIGLYVEERDFLGYLLDKSNSIQIESNPSTQISIPKHSWKIRTKEEELLNWL